MNYINMTYRGVEFKANPSRLNIRLEKQLEKTGIPLFHEKTVEAYEKARIISGEGSFIGENAMYNAQKLMTAFKAKGSSYLFAPSFSPFAAFFTELELSVNAQNGCVDYSFKFTEDIKPKSRYRSFNYTRAKEGENVFDIANRCGTSLEKLVSLNNFHDLFSVSEGDKIWLN